MSKYELFIEQIEEGSRGDVKSISPKSQKELDQLYKVASNPRKVLKLLQDALYGLNVAGKPAPELERFLKKIKA